MSEAVSAQACGLPLVAASGPPYHFASGRTSDRGGHAAWRRAPRCTTEPATGTLRFKELAVHDPEDDHRRWYVAHTQPHRESLAEAHLAQQDFATFLPRRAKTVRHARKTQTILAPVFPRYLFVRFDPDRDRWRSINGTPGVSRLLTANELPTPAPVGVVEALIAATGPRGQLQANFNTGDRVRLIAGPFADALAEIDRLDDAGRVRVLLRIMGADLRVQMPRDWLEKLPPGA